MSIGTMMRPAARRARTGADRGAEWARHGAERGAVLARHGAERGVELARHGAERGVPVLRQGGHMALEIAKERSFEPVRRARRQARRRERRRRLLRTGGIGLGGMLLGFLLAPQSGRDTRAWIGGTARRITHRGGDVSGNGQGTFEYGPIGSELETADLRDR